MKKTTLLCISALFSVIIFLFTAYIFHIPFPSGGGYVHLGDSLMFLCASILPMPYAIFSSLFAFFLSDLLFCPIYIFPTVLVKAVSVTFFASKCDKILSKRNIFAPLFACFVTLFVYFLWDTFLIFNLDFKKGLFSLLFNLSQCFLNTIFYFFIAYLLDRGNFKKRFTED